MTTTLPKNADVADRFELLADLLEIEGAQSYRVLAYRRAAARIRETPGGVAEMALEGKARDLPGIGKTIEDRRIVQDEIEALRTTTGESRRVDLLLRIQDSGRKTVRRIWQGSASTTIEELRTAAAAQRLRTLTGLGAKTEENVLQALAREGNRRTGLHPARPRAPSLRGLIDELREDAELDRISEAGSVRRRRESVRTST